MKVDCIIWILSNELPYFEGFFSQDLEESREEVGMEWGLKSNLGLEKMGEEKLLLEFEFKGEAYLVMGRGSRSFHKFHLNLDTLRGVHNR